MACATPPALKVVPVLRFKDFEAALPTAGRYPKSRMRRNLRQVGVTGPETGAHVMAKTADSAAALQMALQLTRGEPATTEPALQNLLAAALADPARRAALLKLLGIG